MGDDHAALERAGHDPGVGEPVAVGVVHPGLHLEDERAELVVDLADRAVDTRGRAGVRREVEQQVQQLRDAEVLQGRGEHDRRRLPGQEALLVVVGVVEGEQLVLLDRARPTACASCSSTSSERHPLLGGPGGATGGAGVLHELARTAVQDAAEVAGLADRPGQRGGTQLDLLLDEVHQLERRQPGTVPLVDHRDHRDAAQRADLEELEGLRLEPLAGVDQHHRGVDRGQHAVGVLGEVAVAGGVDEVDHVVAVDELQRGRGDRDAARLLHRHPVGHRGAPVALAVDGSRLGDHPRVQRERLGQGGLARVGVADDGEGTAGAGVRHRANLPVASPKRRFAGGRGRSPRCRHPAPPRPVRAMTTPSPGPRVVVTHGSRSSWVPHRSRLLPEHTRYRGNPPAQHRSDWPGDGAHSDAEVALLDLSGTVVAVNEAWERFARENGGDPDRTGVGTSYLAVCESAGDDPVAALAAAAVRAALAGELPAPLSVVIPCHGPDGQRWFDMLVSPRLRRGERPGRCGGDAVTPLGPAGPGSRATYVSTSSCGSRPSCTRGSSTSSSPSPWTCRDWPP